MANNPPLRLGSDLDYPGAAFQNICNVYLFARQSYGAQHGIKKLSRAADERLAPAVLFGARCLAHNEPVSVRITNAKHGLRSSRAQAASSTRRHARPQLVPTRSSLARGGHVTH